VSWADVISASLVDRHGRLVALDATKEDYSAVDQWLAAMMGDDGQ
jgi:hypothetical protein